MSAKSGGRRPLRPSCCHEGVRRRWTAPSTPQVPVTLRAPTSTPQCSTPRSTKVRATAAGNPFEPDQRCLGLREQHRHHRRPRPENAPALVAWKEPLQRRLFGQTGICVFVITSSVAYGDGGGGIARYHSLAHRATPPATRSCSAPASSSWSSVHVADLADALPAVCSRTIPHAGSYVIGNGLNPTVAELTEAAAVAVGAPGAVPGPTTRRVPGSATGSPKCSSSTREPKPPGLAPSSAGSRRMPDSSRSSGLAVTGSSPRPARGTPPSDFYQKVSLR